MSHFQAITLLVFLGLSAFCCTKAIYHSTQNKEFAQRNANVLNFEERLLNPSEWLLSFWETGRKLKEAEILKDKSEKHLQKVNLWTVAQGVLICLLCSLFWLNSKKTGNARRDLGISFAIGSIPLLVLGLLLPAIEIAVFSSDLTIPIEGDAFGVSVDLSKTFSGRMYYFFQEKSTVDAIVLLFSHGEWPVGIFLVVFSVLIPIVKLWAACTTSLFGPDKTGKWGHFVAKHLGKWSMADVFFVSMLLAYFAFNSMAKGVESEVSALAGVYAFGAFVVLSKIAYDLSFPPSNNQS